MHGLVERFFNEEASPYVRDRVRQAASDRTSGVAYLTFNVLHVRLDFDRGLAIIEDELDPESEESTPLAEFLSKVEGGDVDPSPSRHAIARDPSGRAAWEVDGSGHIVPPAGDH